MGRVSCLICIVVLGCSSKEDLACEVTAFDGTATATLDGSAWMADAEAHWTESGTSIMVNLSSDASGRTINIKPKQSIEGVDVLTLIDEERFPIEMDLDDTDGTAGIIDLSNGLSGYETDNPGGGGIFVIASVDGDQLTGCFEFDAVSNDNVVIEVREGQVNIGRRDL